MPHQKPDLSIPQSVLIPFALATVLLAGIAHSAEAITDQPSCDASLADAEGVLVAANIDSTTFRRLNDQLVEIRNLCAQEDYDSARVAMRTVIDVLKEEKGK